MGEKITPRRFCEVMMSGYCTCYLYWDSLVGCHYCYLAEGKGMCSPLPFPSLCFYETPRAKLGSFLDGFFFMFLALGVSLGGAQSKGCHYFCYE